MAQPITWQNVNAPQIDTTRGMAVAGSFINNGFDKLGEIIKQREAVDAANWNNTKTNNTEEIYRQMAQFDTPEAYQAALKSGAIQSIMGGMGAQYDQAGVRQAMNAQMGILQDRTMKANAFQDSTQTHAQKPIVEQAMAMAVSGDPGLKAYLAANPNVTNTAPILQAGIAGAAAKTEAERKAQLAPMQLVNDLAQQKLTTVDIADRTRAASDAAMQRNLDTVLQKATAAHLANKEQAGLPYGKLAELNGIPVDTKGIPRYESLTKNDIAKMDFLAKSNGLAPYSQYAIGDTTAGDNILKVIENSPEFTKEFVQKNREVIRAAADSTKFNGSIGDTAAAKLAASAQTDVAMQERKQNTWYAPNSPNAMNNYEEIAKRIPELVPNEGNRSSVQDAVFKAATKGILLENGSRVVPSMNDILGAIRTTTDDVGPDWLRGVKTHGTNVLKTLKKNLSTADYTQKFIDSEELQVYTRKQAAKNIISGK